METTRRKSTGRPLLIGAAAAAVAVERCSKTLLAVAAAAAAAVVVAAAGCCSERVERFEAVRVYNKDVNQKLTMLYRLEIVKTSFVFHRSTADLYRVL